MACPVRASACTTSRRRAVGRKSASVKSVTPTSLAAFSGARQPGVIRASESWANGSVCEMAAFDGPYNIRLHPTHGTRSRVPRVPALRWYCHSARRG